jgi:hypothetical protein
VKLSCPACFFSVHAAGQSSKQAQQ